MLIPNLWRNVHAECHVPPAYCDQVTVHQCLSTPFMPPCPAFSTLFFCILLVMHQQVTEQPMAGFSRLRTENLIWIPTRLRLFPNQFFYFQRDFRPKQRKIVFGSTHMPQPVSSGPCPSGSCPQLVFLFSLPCQYSTCYKTDRPVVSNKVY